MRPATSPEPIDLSRLIANPVLPAAVAAGTGLLIGAALVSKPIVVVGLIALALGAIGIAVAFTHPSAAFVGLIVLAAFVPTYAAPSIGPLLFIPAAAGSWLLAIALGWRNLLATGRIFKPTIVDLAVGLFVLLMAISISFSPRTSRNEFLHVMFLWAGPYLGARILLADVRQPMKILAGACGLVTAVLAPIALVEYLGASNPFHALNFNATEYATWAGQAARYGTVRAEASFGHPIALSMFAATSALLSLAMALNANARRERNLWYGSAGLAIAVQVFTVSRTGWLMLMLGIVMLVLVFVRGANRKRLITLVSSLAAALLIASILAPSALHVLPGFEKNEGAVDSSSKYREALLTRALEPGVLNAWGNAQNKVTPFVNYGSATDNAYIILADTWGLIPTAALILIALAQLYVVVRWQAQDVEALVALPIAAFVGLVALFFVAFITQQQVFIWLMVGAAAVAAERLSGTKRKDPDQRSAALDRM